MRRIVTPFVLKKTFVNINEKWVRFASVQKLPEPRLTFNAHDTLEGIRDGSLHFKYKKVRQHVNPLAAEYQVSLDLDREFLSQNLNHLDVNPLILDVGCCKGSWALQIATENSNLNVLGLEIRRPIVQFCLERKERMQLKNVHFLNSNANVDLEALLEYLTSRNVDISMVAVQFPDPHFKKKHHKRRVVNSSFVDSLARFLRPKTRLFMQSDVLDAQQAMVECVSASPYFAASSGHDVQRLDGNCAPVAVKTEREIATEAKGLPVYRMLFERNERRFVERDILSMGDDERADDEKTGW